MKAFTLAELLVVMAVMIILMSVAVPVYRHCADFTLDAVPQALQYTNTVARQKGFAAMLIRQDELGTWAICMEASGIPLTASIDLDTKRLQIPDYKPAVVIYNNRGHLRTGMDIIIDGQVYTSTNQLVLDGETKWLHRSMGEIIKQQHAPAGPPGPPAPMPRWGW